MWANRCMISFWERIVRSLFDYKTVKDGLAPFTGNLLYLGQCFLIFKKKKVLYATLPSRRAPALFQRSFIIFILNNFGIIEVRSSLFQHQLFFSGLRLRSSINEYTGRWVQSWTVTLYDSNTLYVSVIYIYILYYFGKSSIAFESTRGLLWLREWVWIWKSEIFRFWSTENI